MKATHVTTTLLMDAEDKPASGDKGNKRRHFYNLHVLRVEGTDEVLVIRDWGFLNTPTKGWDNVMTIKRGQYHQRTHNAQSVETFPNIERAESYVRKLRDMKRRKSEMEFYGTHEHDLQALALITRNYGDLDVTSKTQVRNLVTALHSYTTPTIAERKVRHKVVEEMTAEDAFEVLVALR